MVSHCRIETIFVQCEQQVPRRILASRVFGVKVAWSVQNRLGFQGKVAMAGGGWSASNRMLVCTSTGQAQQIGAGRHSVRALPATGSGAFRCRHVHGRRRYWMAVLRVAGPLLLKRTQPEQIGASADLLGLWVRNECHHQSAQVCCNARPHWHVVYGCHESCDLEK